MSNVFAPPVDLRLDAEILAALADETYARVARSPYVEFHFHTGANYAMDRLGYDAGELLALPEWLEAAGFYCARVVHRFDSFAGTVSGRRIPRKYNLYAASIVAWRA